MEDNISFRLVGGRFESFSWSYLAFGFFFFFSSLAPSTCRPPDYNSAGAHALLMVYTCVIQLHLVLYLFPPRFIQTWLYSIKPSRSKSFEILVFSKLFRDFLREKKSTFAVCCCWWSFDLVGQKQTGQRRRRKIKKKKTGVVCACLIESHANERERRKKSFSTLSPKSVSLFFF